MTTRAGRLAVALALTLGVAARTAAMDVLRLSFDDVVDRAGSIVHATVTAVASGRDAEGIPATWITLDVAECLKGPPEPFLTIKQAGVDEPLADGVLLHVPGLPRYRVGDEVVLFLHQPSGRGFTSPVGLGQGLYRIEASAAGPAVRAALTVGADAGEALPAFLERVRQRVGR